MIVAIEGGDACGKATQARILVERLQRERVDVDAASFPNYATATGQSILRLLRGERQVMRTAYGVQQVDDLDGALALQDRYWLSGLVYGLADGLDERWLLDVHRALPAAHHVVVDVPTEEALRRRSEARDLFEADRAKQVRVRSIYTRVVKDPPEDLRGRVYRVDGLGNVEDVAGRIWAIVDQLTERT